MIVTEQEASTKRCQESYAAQAVVSPDGSPITMATASWGKAIAIPTAPSNCIGSACMAWRWDRYVDDDGEERILTESSGERCGYCGKAGGVEPRKSRP